MQSVPKNICSPSNLTYNKSRDGFYQIGFGFKQHLKKISKESLIRIHIFRRKGLTMKKLFIIKSLLLATILITTDAYALLIEGSFYGKVRTFSNGAEDINLTGYWDNVTEGSEVSGSFWYDTDKAPENTSEFQTSSFYQTYSDEWMGSNFSIDGKTYYISDLSLLDGYNIKSEGVWLQNFEPAIDDSTKEMFYLFDNISTGGAAGGYKAIGLMVEVSSEINPLLNGLGIIQEFDWYDSGNPTAYAQAYIDVGAITSNERKASNAWVDISEFHLSVKNNTTVPEPSSLILLLLCGLALIIKRKWSQQIKNFAG